MKKISISLLIILLGASFIFSGITKFLVINVYEIMLVKQHLATWESMRFVSRLIIAFEIALGTLLIAHYRLSFLLKITLYLLLVFSIFLGLQILLGAELENCFCFGETWQLSSSQSLLKNALLILVSIVAFKNQPYIRFERFKKWQMIGGVFFISLTSVVILHPPINIYEEFSIDTFSVGDVFPSVEELPKEVYKGKSIILFLSATCSHCEQVALKSSILEKQNNLDYTLYPVFGLGMEGVDEFRKKTDLQTTPIFINKRDFLKFTKGVFPQVYILENGNIKSILNKREFLEKKL
jgi:hypothetical protein